MAIAIFRALGLLNGHIPYGDTVKERKFLAGSRASTPPELPVQCPMESLFRSPETECLHRTRFAARHEARAAPFETIEIFYNPKGTIRA